MSRSRSVRSTRPAQHGFSLVELLVAMLIALFVLAGATGAMLTQKRNLAARDRYAQVQEMQRIASAVLDNVVASAGYFPDPATMLPATIFPALAPFGVAGQTISGTTGTGTASDTLSTRALAGNAATDPVMACNGDVNAGGTAAQRVMSSTFSVDATNQQLMCTVGGTTAAAAVAIVNGVQKMKVLYGVDADGDGSIDGYATSAQVGTNWSQVRLVEVTLTMVNPNTDLGDTTPLTLVRAIPVMNVMSIQ